ncbi:hypothetical protein ACH5BK_00695 [Arcobacter sp. YIC-80]|uniref:hypothetical protein n=1 Tax=Arcobacter sp. YIC-80 TaxID=3376683 RepID=UPI00384F7309
MSIESIAREITEIKNELNELSERYESKRLEMYSSLTNNGLESFRSEEYLFTKVPETTFLTITKSRLHEALNNSSISDEQKIEIQNIAFEETTRDANLRITKI